MQWLQKLVAKAQGRSSRWPAARKEHLRRYPTCAVCGSRKKPDVHHLYPFHLFPEQELDPANLITLCRAHHLLFGHLTEWSSLNPNCVDDCQRWRAKIQERP